VETLTGIKFVKNTETGQFLFFLAHILTHMVNGFCIAAPGSAQPPPTFFFKRKGISSDTSFERPICKEYNALFVS
jgi:hypothetical protein